MPSLADPGALARLRLLRLEQAHVLEGSPYPLYTTRRTNGGTVVRTNLPHPETAHWDRRGPHLRLTRRLRADGNDYLDVTAGDELCGVGAKAFRLPLRPTAFDLKILALDPAILTQALQEGGPVPLLSRARACLNEQAADPARPTASGLLR